jgi:Cof subfamily protein (haloacid dehalogenase superfamily)
MTADASRHHRHTQRGAVRTALIATDLDGTLLRSDRTISPRTRAALRAAQDRDVAVAFVTARPPWAVELLADQIDLSGLAICLNGAAIYDLDRHEVIDRQTFSLDAYRALIGELRACAPGIAFVVQQGGGALQDFHEHRFPPLWADWTGVACPRIECALTIPGDTVAKIIAHHPTHGADALRDLIAAAVETRADASHSDPRIVELSPVGVSKASGVVALCRILGIELGGVIAFGDMPNDIPMLSIVGHSVGMANAHAEVLSVVDEVTASNDDDGVALVLERLLTNGSGGTKPVAAA